MGLVHGLMMFVWQSPYDAGAHEMFLIRIGVWVIAGGMLIMLLALCIGGFIALKFFKKIDALVDDTKSKCDPIFTRGVEFFDDVAPKVRSITANVEQISFTAREKVDELGETVSQLNRTVADINSKTRVQVTRVDGIVTEALATTHQISKTVQEGIRVPVRQISGIVAGLKAGLEKLVERSPFAANFRKGPRTPGPYDL